MIYIADGSLLLSIYRDLILDRDRGTCFVSGNSFEAGWTGGFGFDSIGYAPYG
jgi:hypothetical protein